MMEKILRGSPFEQLFTVHGLYTLPFAPLIGIKKPALALEIGLKQKDNWKLLLNQLLQVSLPCWNNEYYDKKNVCTPYSL